MRNRRMYGSTNGQIFGEGDALGTGYQRSFQVVESIFNRLPPSVSVLKSVFAIKNSPKDAGEFFI